MKQRWIGLAALLGAGWVSGCVFSIGGSGGAPSRHEPSKPPPVVMVPANTEDGAVLAEIDAAGKLSFDAGRVTTLKNVAARTSLSPAAQVHLVNTTLRVLDFEAGKVEVLNTLIVNPAFSPAAKEAILRQLERLEFDASRLQVMQAIQARGESR